MKYQFLCYRGNTEVAAFGVPSKDDPLYLVDLAVVPQEASGAFVAMDDEGVADHFEDMVDLGFKPGHFGRVWLHTHPEMSATPSGVDETTFENAFGRCDWAVMGIVSRTGDSYARLRVRLGPPDRWIVDEDWKIPMKVDWESLSKPGQGVDLDAWEEECRKNVRLQAPSPYYSPAFLKWERAMEARRTKWMAEEQDWRGARDGLPSNAGLPVIKDERKSKKAKKRVRGRMKRLSDLTDAEYRAYEESLNRIAADPTIGGDSVFAEFDGDQVWAELYDEAGLEELDELDNFHQDLEFSGPTGFKPEPAKPINGASSS